MASSTRNRRYEPIHDRGDGRTQIFFDLETTSLSRSSGITQIAAMTSSGDKFFNQYVIPDRNIDPEASEITGLTLWRGKLYLDDKLVKRTKPQADALADFLSFVEGFARPILIAHNCQSFDSKVLVNALERSDLVDRFASILARGGFADSLPLFRRVFSDCEKHSLEYLGWRIFDRKLVHDALEDVEVLRDLATLPDLKNQSFTVFSVKDVLHDIAKKRFISEFVYTCGLSKYMGKKLVDAGHTLDDLVEVYYREGDLGVANAIARTTIHTETISKITQVCLDENQERYADDEAIQIFMSACHLRSDLATELVHAGYTLDSLVKMKRNEGTRAVRKVLKRAGAHSATIGSIIWDIDRSDTSSSWTTVQDSERADRYSHTMTNRSEYSTDSYYDYDGIYG